MNCDFYQDDNSEIWLVFVEDLIVRNLTKSPLEEREEEAIILQQRLKREKREEWRKLEKAEWKEFK